MIPGRYSRIAVYKGLQDILRFPGLRSALKLIVHSLLGGDVSPWDSAMQLPHYQDDGMPGISLHSALHLIQLVKSKKFQMFDYGDPEVRLVETIVFKQSTIHLDLDMNCKQELLPY